MSTIKWSDAAVTPEGLELQAELLKGGGLEFTRVTGADANGENKATLSIQPATVEGSKITVPVLLNNTDLTVGFTMTQIRFYAKGTGAAPGYEILYAVAQDADGDYIPSAAESPGFTIDWSYTFQFGNADNMTVVLDPAGLVSMSLVGQANGLATLDGNGQVPLSQLTAMIQGTSIAAAYDSESAYAKGDYCVKDGLLYKASVDIESPEAWNEDHWSAVNIMTQVVNTSQVGEPNGVATLDENGRLPEEQLTPITGEDIPTSASDPTSISSQLSNRLRIPVDISIGSDLDNIKSAGMYFCGAAQDVSNTSPNPNGETAFALMVEKTYALGVKQTLSWYYSEGAYYRTFDGSAWHDWIPLATATPPQEFNLPLADGWSGWAKYSKDQFGRVLVYGLVAKSTALISGDVIGTLPEGFRPSATCPMTITSGNASDGKSFATSGYVQPLSLIHI